MRGLESESVDLIYLDPPFNSKRMYSGNLDPKIGKQSFKDIWTMSDVNKDDLWRLETLLPRGYALINAMYETHGESWKAYLVFMAIRLIEMHRLLKQTGSIYLHCDWHMNSPLRLLMDVIFGKDNFRNEVVWCYKENDTATKHFPRKHDTILFYTKAGKYTFNIQRGEITEAQKKRYNRIINGERWAYMKGKMRKLAGGAKVRDWWEMKIVQSNERTGWATQKPLELLERIIKASSNEGDIVLDPFCGCATACVAAEPLRRQWIGIDIDPAADEIMKERVEKDTALVPMWDKVERIDAHKASNLPRRDDVVEIDKKDPRVKEAIYKRQNEECASGKWCLSSRQVDISLLDIDRIDPGKRGGQYTPDNVQLLCRACNTAKGSRSWSQFIKERREAEARVVRDDPDVPRYR